MSEYWFHFFVMLTIYEHVRRVLNLLLVVWLRRRRSAAAIRFDVHYIVPVERTWKLGQE